MRESHAIIVLFLVGSKQVLPLFDTQRGVKEIWWVKYLPQLFLPSCLDVEGKKYLLLLFFTPFTPPSKQGLVLVARTKFWKNNPSIYRWKSWERL